MQILYSELQNKEVININDCKKLGYISDILIDTDCGKIISVTVRECGGLFQNKAKEVSIFWDSIRKIGDELIFVDACCVQQLPPEKDRKKFLF
ncbi:MAG: YlmC/YmxH family sporulation protein [Clostridia bacterium]|nr:YlmC/YmxH family sporulation protein [Clostridia bacterium]MBR4979109.1 YlmC/YmxH family sporulation protein [Clostridia bacterium]